MSEPQVFSRQNILYQPTLTPAEIEMLRAGKFALVAQKIREHSKAERVSVDRLAMICTSLPSPIEELTFLDLGCANGFFCNGLALLGAAGTHGVDSDVHKNTLGLEIDSALLRARMDAETYGACNVHFSEFDLKELMTQPRPEMISDVTLFLSVFHHMFFGYGFLNHTDSEVALGDKASSVLRWVDAHTRQVLYFEMHEGIYSDWNRTTIPDQIRAFTTFTKIELLGNSDGYEKTPRGVWRCSR